MAAEGVDAGKVAALKWREDSRFAETHPRCIEMWRRADRVMPNGVPMSWFSTGYDHPAIWVDEAKGSRFRDVDGNEYADFNIADMSMFGGYGPEPVVEAVSRRIAIGSQFLLPNEDSIWVAEELARRYGLPQWQFTLSATGANLEAIRVARVATGRERVLFFGGKYHGHFDEGLVELEHGEVVPEEAGLPSNVTDNVSMVPFNDVDALRSALEGRRVAIVVTEPALTNFIGLLLPEPGFHDALRSVTRETGTLLAYDETHTHVVGPGGLTAMWGLDPDIVTIGKSIAGGVPLGAYGMSDEVAETLRAPTRPDSVLPIVATGGTLFANPLSMAAAKATLGDVLTSEAYAHTRRLGERLADGIEAAIGAAGLPWTTHRFWPRSGYTFAPTMPRDSEEALTTLDVPLRNLIRVYLANRGVWEAIVGAGPTCSVPASEADVDAYVGAFGSLIGELTS
jgi:glutamate-1-semialdehyde 2,1-aminomutase